MKNNFRVILATQKQTISDVHKNTGIAKSTLIRLYYERSKNPESKTLIKISNFLGVTVDELLGLTKQKEG